MIERRKENAGEVWEDYTRQGKRIMEIKRYVGMYVERRKKIMFESKYV